MNNSPQTRDFVTPDLFWHAVNILITKPHVINKRLWGCKILSRFMCNHLKTLYELSALPVKLQDSCNIDVFMSGLNSLMKIQLTPSESGGEDSEIVLTELLPKSYGEKHAFQLILIQKKESMVTFYDVTPIEYNQNLCPNFSYRFYLQDKIRLLADADETYKPCQWLMTTVLPQLTKWSLEANSTHQSINKSLALVSHDQYYVKYNELKEKYGRDLLKIWPECTDPSKFVYEDIAIATYLLLLWEENNNECNTVISQRFVDLGCGNGLLVYILTMEGHHGYGIDVRRRKIWDIYPENIKLIEKTITPSNIDMFTEVDWIIGNHSDELTPWIPVITARSSYQCKFFLLPCCAYNFDGTKYQRRNSSKSQYMEYLEYIKKLSEDCGFQILTDRLKIPSTKRICFVGKKRKYQENEFNLYSESIGMLIKSATCINTGNIECATDIQNFKAREAKEKVRNCTQVDKKIVNSIICSVAQYLLEGCKQNSEWSTGKIVDISEIVSLLSPDILKVLKSECGGLQTLLKNNHHIFKVRSGKIQLQYPKTIDVMNTSITNNKRFNSKVKLKIKECWFFQNHPQGCPLKDTECSFLH